MTKFHIYTCLFLLVFASNASANGGPVEWTGTTPLGGVGLKQNQNISLKEETLKIKMLENLNSYEVNAEYILDNPDKAEVVEFGVPLSWFEDEEFYLSKSQIENLIKESPDEFLLSDIQGRSKGIHISVNGKESQCELALNRKHFNLNDSADIEPGAQTIKSWCVSKIRFNKGINKIEMKYVAQMSYVDEAYSKSALTYFGPRRLNYIFYPAGYWSGNAGKVSVEIDLGAYNNLEKVNTPLDFKKQGSRLYWEQSNVDFKKIKELDMVFDKKILKAHQLATWNSNKYNYYPINKASKVHASSYLKSNGSTSYQPENLLDGKPETAWCEGSPDDGIGEYVDIQTSDSSFGSGMKEYCNIQGLMVTAGYMKNQHVYELNNRISKIKVSGCDGENLQIFELDVNDNYLLSPLLIQNILPEGQWEKFISEYQAKHGNDYTHPDYVPPLAIMDFIKNVNCFRIEVQSIDKGKVSDTCISEISLVINCG